MKDKANAKLRRSAKEAANKNLTFAALFDLAEYVARLEHIGFGLIDSLRILS